MADRLKVGDTVLWRGGWGNESAKKAKVTGLTLTNKPHVKYGEAVESVAWGAIFTDRCLVDLDNGHWAYGNQIRPLKEE